MASVQGNVSAVTQIANAALSLAGLVLVTPQTTKGYQPLNPPSSNGQPAAQNPPALLFHYEGEQTVKLQSDITDHYIEDNTAVQDQISLKPEEITTHGFIGELNDIAPPILQPVQQVANKLTSIGAYLPSLSVSALLAYNTAFQLYQTGANAASTAVAAWGTVTGTPTGGQSVIGSNGVSIQPNQNKQQLMFQQFYGYWRARTLFNVQTPWAVFTNMAIMSLTAVQDDITNVITDFQVTFKMIRIATTQLSLFDPANAQGQLVAQSSSPVNLGNNTPASSISVSSGLASV